MSFTVTNQAPITIQITSPTVATLEVYPSVVNELSGTPVYVGDTAGGDLTGTYPNPTVHQIHGKNMQSGNPSDGDIWQYHNAGSQWQHKTLAQAGIAASTHKHSLADGDILDVNLAGYDDPVLSATPILVYDLNDEIVKVATGYVGDVSVVVTATGEISTQFANKLGTIPRVKARSGTYETVAVAAAQGTTVSLALSCAHYIPFMPQFDMTMTNFVIAISSGGAGSNLRMALYASDADTGWISGSPQIQTAAFSGATSGVIETAPATGNFNLYRNVQYWLALQTDSSITQPTVRTVNVGSLIPLYHSLTTNNMSCQIFENGTVTFGTWRNFTTNPVVTADFATTANTVPALGVKVL